MAGIERETDMAGFIKNETEKHFGPSAFQETLQKFIGDAVISSFAKTWWKA